MARFLFMHVCTYVRTYILLYRYVCGFIIITFVPSSGYFKLYRIYSYISYLFKLPQIGSSCVMKCLVPIFVVSILMFINSIEFIFLYTKKQLFVVTCSRLLYLYVIFFCFIFCLAPFKLYAFYCRKNIYSGLL